MYKQLRLYVQTTSFICTNNFKVRDFGPLNFETRSGIIGHACQGVKNEQQTISRFSCRRS